MLEVVPITLKEANAFVEQNHRHHGPTVDEYGTYRVRQNGQFIGTAIYSGPAEWNRAENICHFGTKTIFRPARPLETTVIEFLTDESDGENT